MESQTLTVKVISPDKVLFNGTAEYLTAPGRHGSLGILPGHTPLFSELIKGEVYIKGENEAIVAIESGILKVRSDTVTILAINTG